MGGASKPTPAGAPVGGNLGSFSTVQNLVKPFIGVGILAMPATWAKGGLIASSVLLMLLCAAATWCILRLVECTDTIMRCEADYNRRVRLALERQKERAQGSMFPSQETPEDVAESIPFFPPPAPPVEEMPTEKSEYPPVSAAAEAAAAQAFPSDPDSHTTPEDWASITVPSFTEVGRAAFGYWGAAIVDFSIIVTQFGSCVAYLIFVSSNMSDLTPISQPLWVVMQGVPLALLCLVRRNDVFAPASSLANFAYLFTVGMLLFDGAEDCCIPSSELNLVTIAQLPTVFGICSFSLEGIALIIPVKRRMAEPHKFTPLMIIAGASVGSLYLLMAISGYIFFGADVVSPVIKSLHSGWRSSSVKIALSLSIFFSYVLMAFPVSEFFDQVIDNAMDLDIQGRLKEVNDARLQSGKAAGGDEAASPTSPSVVGVTIPNAGSGSLNADASAAVAGSAGIAPPAAAPNSPSGASNTDLLTEDDVHLLYPSRYIRRWWFQTLARVAFVAATCGVAIVFPNFELILMLFGSFTLSLLAYILPPIFWMRIMTPTHLYGRDWFPFSRTGKPHVGGPGNATNDDDDADTADDDEEPAVVPIGGADAVVANGPESAAAAAAAAAASTRRARVALLSDSDSEASVHTRARRAASPAGSVHSSAASIRSARSTRSARSGGSGRADEGEGSLAALSEVDMEVEDEWPRRPVTEKIMVYALPATVFVVGIMASCVGLTKAIINIKNDL